MIDKRRAINDIDEDLAWLESRYRRLDLPGWPAAEIFDGGGRGEALIFVPVPAPFDVIHVPGIRHFSETFRIVGYRRRESADRRIYPAERAAEIAAIMNALGIQRAHFCGLNEGAIAAFSLAKTEPERVASIVCTSIGMDNVVPRFEQWLGRAIRLDLSPALVGKAISALMLRKAPDNFLVAHLWSKNPKPMVALRNGVLPLYERYDLPVRQLTMPVLNINSSPVVSLDSARRFVEALPHGYLREIPGYCHLCMWTRPAEFNALMEEFYSRIMPADARS
ncbi:MAG: alpha/beta hydrolase [Spirochaetes bacterium]|nr:alpha/beta hydrolase [Spirochaetota bacterium]MBU1079464.1 alpha/beta hydrolase [Spirochaetota bacterium]